MSAGRTWSGKAYVQAATAGPAAAVTLRGPDTLAAALLPTRFVQEDRLLAFVQCVWIQKSPILHQIATTTGLSGQHAGASDAHRHLEEDADRKHLRRPAAGGLSWLPGVAHAFST